MVYAVLGEREGERGRPERYGVAVALRRRSSACAHGMAPRGEAEMLQENQERGEGRGSARGRRRRHGVTAKTEGGDGVRAKL